MDKIDTLTLAQVDVDKIVARSYLNSNAAVEADVLLGASLESVDPIFPFDVSVELKFEARMYPVTYDEADFQRLEELREKRLQPPSKGEPAP